MTKDLSRVPRWDILRNFYRDFDNGHKRGCVEKWKKEMPQSRFEQELFESRIQTEFLRDRQKMLNKCFCWTYANMKKIIALDQRFRELHRSIARTFEATKRDIAALTAQNAAAPKQPINFSVFPVFILFPSFCDSMSIISFA